MIYGRCGYRCPYPDVITDEELNTDLENTAVIHDIRGSSNWSDHSRQLYPHLISIVRLLDIVLKQVLDASTTRQIV